MNKALDNGITEDGRLTYITGAIRAYSEVVEDLRALLDESEGEE